MEEHPKVFVSYSQDSESLKQWVLELCTKLREHGVDLILDQWDLILGQDLRFFMEQGLSSSKKVLCICSDEYVKKVNSGQRGAGYEGMIMTSSLLDDCNQDYIIPIIKDNTNKYGKVPIAFKSKYYLDFSNKNDYYDNYRKLLANIYEQDKVIKPRLGISPFSRSVSETVQIETEIKKAKYISPEMDGAVSFNFDNNNSIYYLGSGDYCFRTRWSNCGINAIYAYGNIGYKEREYDFPLVENIVDFDFTSNCRTIYKNEIVVFQNENSHFAAIKIGNVTSKYHGNGADVLNFKYHIYH